VEEQGESENQYWQQNFNNSTTMHPFQTIISSLERSTSIDALQLFEQCNTTSIYDAMTILVSTIPMQRQRIILVHREKEITQQPLI
jgi:hypothetical protein